MKVCRSTPAGLPRRQYAQRLYCFLLLCTSSCATVLSAANAADFVVERDVMVPMRDGVQLSTDVYRPAVDGQATSERLPVILTRTPYNKSGASDAGEYFATHGYVFVSQDTRGRYGSEGVWHMLTDDGRDGVDCAAWIGKQPWSSGKIGMIGTSYVGGTQHALALEHAPEVKTVIPADAMSNLGRQSMRNAGAYRTALLELDRSERRSRQPRRQGSRHGGSAPGNGRLSHHLSQEPADAAGNDAAETRARIRSLAGGGHGARRQRRVLGAEQHRRRAATISGHAGLSRRAAGTTRGAATRRPTTWP